MKCSQPLRVDYEEGVASFVTRRARNSQLVFANNKRLEDRVLGSLGKYLEKYQTSIYGLCLFGSHDHNLLAFQPGTKSKFFRDFGARTAEAVKKYVTNFGEGSVLGARTSEQAVPPEANGYLESIMYIALQPIAAGLCKNLSDYPGFNCFHHLVTGKPLEVEFFNGAAFNKANKTKKKADPENFIERYTINFARIPGYETMTQKEYAAFLNKEFERRRKEIISQFEQKGYKWPAPSSLRMVKPTERARKPKKSVRNGFRPLVICKCPIRKQAFLDWYFAKLETYRGASTKYLAGVQDAIFPSGTNKPPGPFVWST